MNPPDDEFLARLLLTFREEAQDHLDILIAGILDLEKNDEKSQVSRIEPIFRATHSLKGAACAVGLRDIETLCQNLESVFSSVKNGKILLHPPEFDQVHQAIAMLEALLAGEKKMNTSAMVLELKKIASSSGSGEQADTPDTNRQEGYTGTLSAGEKPGKPET
ncbi:MAG: Hpt domain-containing protein, partial [Methanospirillum sp.]|nr:Hpt domain-containing protein [Methanospirillum sp.]